ncbi:MAG: J domain-containing protein [Actinobacteria bacterium]|nr:J domain-containing protein [Actinomycetota bacterium]
MAAPDWSNADFYTVLGVPADASPKDVTRAFRRCALECHPDTHPGDAAAADRFLEVVAAYDVLGDDVTRREYDLFRRFGVDALDRADVLASGVRGVVFAAPVPPSPGQDASSRRRAWLLGALAAVAVVFGAVMVATKDARRDAAQPTVPSVTSLAPLAVDAAGDSSQPSDFAYRFSDIDCGPGGWSGIFTNADVVPFTGEVSAVAMQGEEVVARGVAAPVAPVPPGGQRQLQFNWQGVPPVGSQCRIERVVPDR